ncbi:MAG TPA: FAD-dependent oxidoreductase [Spirochaetota bacterium]|nr:FAD-dependent oxidoreductase [Spirochaetota bacterium]HPS86171.1 FAD-dependent oxidoreductase [Spirochaetota bacterium]
MSEKKIVIIGGSAAGPKAASKARRLDENAEIIIIQKEKDLSMASCGYPYYVGGNFPNREQLICTPTGVIRDPQFFRNVKAITAKTETEVFEIDKEKKVLKCRNSITGELFSQDYDRLIITTGSVPNIPNVPGNRLEGISTLQSMQDADYLRKVRDEKKVKNAVVIGGGLIGVETCEALQNSGIKTTVIEILPQLMTFLDVEMAKLVEKHIKSKGVNIITENGLAEFIGVNGILTGVKLNDGTVLPCELAVISIGVKPNSALAVSAGLSAGVTGGISVNEFMQSSDPDIYAAGDCVEIKHLISGKNVHAPFGDLANLQGRAAGENAVLGNSVKFKGTIGTGICKVFDYGAGSTGLTEKSARENGFDIETAINAGPDKPGFMNGKLLITKLVINKPDGKILGAQVTGPGDVSKQLAIWAMAIQGNMTVEDMINADLPYAPPYSLAIDHSITTAHIMQNKMKGRMKGISAYSLKSKLDAGENPFILDLRGPDEFAEIALGIGEKLIPLGALRKRIEEIPADKNHEIICYCKVSLRGYEGAAILGNMGWKNVKVLEGGIGAWPF